MRVKLHLNDGRTRVIEVRDVGFGGEVWREDGNLVWVLTGEPDDDGTHHAVCWQD